MSTDFAKRLADHARSDSSIEDVEADLKLFEAGSLRVEYAPFDYIEEQASIVIVGLTPGRQQARNASVAFMNQIKSGSSLESALEVAKKTGSFSGPLRRNLTAMLDHVGLPRVLGLERTEELFAEGARGAHFTSAIRYPTYRNGENYSGTPRPLSVQFLRTCIDTYLGEEATRLNRAIWIPLGAHASDALLYLVKKGALQRNRVFAGLPHPSGANAERISYFLGRKPRHDLSKKTRPEPLDQARATLMKQVAAL